MSGISTDLGTSAKKFRCVLVTGLTMGRLLCSSGGGAVIDFLCSTSEKSEVHFTLNPSKFAGPQSSLEKAT